MRRRDFQRLADSLQSLSPHQLHQLTPLGYDSGGRAALPLQGLRKELHRNVVYHWRHRLPLR